MFHPAWVAITNNEHYVKLHGLRQLVSNSDHRQEIVAGNLADFLKDGERPTDPLAQAQSITPSAGYDRAYAHVSGKCASYHEIMLRARLNGIQNLVTTLLPHSVEEVAEVRHLFPRCTTRVNHRAYWLTFRRHICSSLLHDQKLSRLVLPP